MGTTRATMNVIPCLKLGAGIGTASRNDSKTGAIKDTLQLKTWDIHNANAVPNANLSILLAAMASTSVGVTQHGIDSDIKFTQRVHEPVVTGINNHRDL